MSLQLLHSNTLIISADLEHIEEARDYFTDFLRQHPSSLPELSAWELAFTEVVSNAIIHGSKPKLHDRVTISWSKNDKKITLSVSDNGHGPHPSILDNPRLPDDPLAESGRGIFIISQFADEWLHIKTKNKYTQKIIKNHHTPSLPN